MDTLERNTDHPLSRTFLLLCFSPFVGVLKCCLTVTDKWRKNKCFSVSPIGRGHQPKHHRGWQLTQMRTARGVELGSAWKPSSSERGLPFSSRLCGSAGLNLSVFQDKLEGQILSVMSLFSYNRNWLKKNESCEGQMRPVKGYTQLTALQFTRSRLEWGWRQVEPLHSIWWVRDAKLKRTTS